MQVLKDMKIGDSLFDEDGAEQIEAIMAKARKNGVIVHLPKGTGCALPFPRLASLSHVFVSAKDFVTADCFHETAATGIASVKKVRQLRGIIR